MAKTPLEIASLARMHTKKAVKTLAAIEEIERAAKLSVSQVRAIGILLRKCVRT